MWPVLAALGSLLFFESRYLSLHGATSMAQLEVILHSGRLGLMGAAWAAPFLLVGGMLGGWLFGPGRGAAIGILVGLILLLILTPTLWN